MNPAPIHRKLHVSVPLCTYNGTAFIVEQLESILRQSRPADEIIVCDDGSTDNTLPMVKELAEQYPTPVRIIRNPENLGATKNHEKAILECTGDIIIPSDFDDCWLPDRVSTTLAFFERDPSAVLFYCDAILTDADLKPTARTLFSRREVLTNAVPTAQQLGQGIRFNGPMMAFRAELTPFLRPFSNQWAWDHWIGFIAYAVGEVRPINQALLYYRRHRNNRGVDPDLDGGFLYRWQAATKYSTLKNYTQRRRCWEDMIAQFQRIRSLGLPPFSARFEELLSECERCFRFAHAREMQKRKPRLRRVPQALGNLARGSYHLHAHGLKSFIQDVVIE